MAGWVMAGLMALLSAGFAAYAAQCQAQRDKALNDVEALKVGVAIQAAGIKNLRTRLDLAMGWGADLALRVPMPRSRRCPGGAVRGGEPHDFQHVEGGHCGRCGWGHK